MPTLKHRGNLYYYDATLNTIGTLIKTKPKGYRNTLIRVSCLPMEVIAPNEIIELDVVMGGNSLGGSPTKNFYRQARKLIPGDGPERFYVFNYKFTGWSTDEMVMLIYLERRSDTSVNGTPSQVDLFVDRVSMISY